ncbi:MAG: radical SAM protein [Acidobacteriota bacterium]|jgi:wyosine [tRNA(Phe)-imidazoG37] synthetase (radical SAM superfamily)|nr:radical SAM protein [Acidobacteriota bacterium]
MAGDGESYGRLAEAWRRHERRWKEHRFVYAVVSRRSRGVSVGINLSPEKACNFNCVYCQVDRKSPASGSSATHVDFPVLSGELDRILQSERAGVLYDDAPFDALTPAERGVRDIAFSGDGEPTAYPGFEEAVRIAVEARRKHGLQNTKLVLITNAAYLDKPAVRSALALLDENGGEVWAKLDAGTERFFREVNRTDVSLDRILENILDAACRCPVVIQSLWMRLRGEGPSAREIESYCGRLGDILDAGGRLKSIQLHTVMRHPAESHVTPLTGDELGQIGDFVKSRLPIPVEVFG